jgi:hypothetical protein
MRRFFTWLRGTRGKAGTHGSFTMEFLHNSPSGAWWTVDRVAYAVIPYPSTNPVWKTGDAGRIFAGFTDFQKQTEVTTHELTEALTDPVVWQDSSGAWHGSGWHSNPKTSDTTFLTGDNFPEIGDIANLNSTYLDGYVVQREWSNYFNRNIAPLIETFGAPLGMGLPGWSSSWQISNGREQGLAFQSPYYPTQYLWFLPDGSGSGWFMPG